MKLYSLTPLPLLAFVWLTGVPLHTAAAAQTPKAGDAAPLIEGKDQDGKTWKLADVLGKKVVLLYFYPKDDTPGCTKEACGFRDRMADLKQDKVVVIGVSFDSPESHQKFIAKYKRLIPDSPGLHKRHHSLSDLRYTRANAPAFHSVFLRNVGLDLGSVGPHRQLWPRCSIFNV